MEVNSSEVRIKWLCSNALSALKKKKKKPFYFNILMHACVLSLFIHVQLLVSLWTIAYQTPLSVGCSRQEYKSGLPCPPSRDLPNPARDRTLVSTISTNSKWVQYH